MLQSILWSTSEKLSGDAKLASQYCNLVPKTFDDIELRSGDVIIDAIFGAGLARSVPENVASIIARVSAAELLVVAVDLPSGLCGRRGIVLGSAFQAAVTVTFMARKPGHLLVPGRQLCGQVEVFDIGILTGSCRSSAARHMKMARGYGRSICPLQTRPPTNSRAVISAFFPVR